MSPLSEFGYDRCSGQVRRAIIVDEGIIQFGIDIGMRSGGDDGYRKRSDAPAVDRTVRRVVKARRRQSILLPNSE